MPSSVRYSTVTVCAIAGDKVTVKSAVALIPSVTLTSSIDSVGVGGSSALTIVPTPTPSPIVALALADSSKTVKVSANSKSVSSTHLTLATKWVSLVADVSITIAAK